MRGLCYHLLCLPIRGNCLSTYLSIYLSGQGTTRSRDGWVRDPHSHFIPAKWDPTLGPHAGPHAGSALPTPRLFGNHLHLTCFPDAGVGFKLQILGFKIPVILHSLNNAHTSVFHSQFLLALHAGDNAVGTGCPPHL